MSSANPGLAYEDTPPLSAPLRFFLTAPVFGLIAGLVLIFDGELLGSRWTPGALAVVHLIAAGFMLQVMLGALLQILPVVAGAAFPAPLRPRCLPAPPPGKPCAPPWPESLRLRPRTSPAVRRWRGWR